MAYKKENEFEKLRRRGTVRMIAAVLTILILAVVIIFINRASIKRAFKDVKSEYNNGMPRTIEVYSPDGNLLQKYDGKIDVETNPSYIVFEDEDGKRHIIYPGASTVLIDEQ